MVYHHGYDPKEAATLNALWEGLGALTLGENDLAFAKLTKASRGGNAVAQRNLAKLKEQGLGTALNIRKESHRVRSFDPLEEAQNLFGQARAAREQGDNAKANELFSRANALMVNYH